MLLIRCRVIKVNFSVGFIRHHRRISNHDLSHPSCSTLISVIIPWYLTMHRMLTTPYAPISSSLSLPSLFFIRLQLIISHQHQVHTFYSSSFSYSF